MDPSPESVKPRSSDCTTRMSSGLGGGLVVGDVGKKVDRIARANGELEPTANVFRMVDERDSGESVKLQLRKRSRLCVLLVCFRHTNQLEVNT